MTVFKQTWLVNRRHVLRGLGVSIALPMLNCMRPLLAAPAAPKAKRSVFIYLPNGVNTLDYQILESGSGYRFSRGLRPLERHRAHITPISGLHHPNGLGHHHDCQSIWLTGAEIGQGKRNRISLDQLIAGKLAAHTRFASLELSDTGRSLAFTSGGIGLPAETKPRDVFRRLFEAPGGGVGKERERCAGAAACSTWCSTSAGAGSQDRQRRSRQAGSIPDLGPRGGNPHRTCRVRKCRMPSAATSRVMFRKPNRAITSAPSTT